jgi:hypothetical protein
VRVKAVIFYGDLSQQGFSVSYWLLSRKIEHEFVFFDDMILSIRKIRDIGGYDAIQRYIESLQWVIDIEASCRLLKDE